MLQPRALHCLGDELESESGSDGDAERQGADHLHGCLDTSSSSYAGEVFRVRGQQLLGHALWPIALNLIPTQTKISQAQGKSDSIMWLLTGSTETFTHSPLPSPDFRQCRDK